jgi:hypothetical protein
MKNVLVASLVCLTLGTSANAFAEEASSPAPLAAPLSATDPGPLVGGNKLWLAGTVAQSPTVFLALNMNGGLMLGAGLAATYNGNGVGGSPGSSSDKFASRVVLYASYMVHNVMPFAMGPEILGGANITPNGGDSSFIQPVWAVWYAPWHAPIGIGSAAGVNVAFDKGQDPVASLTMLPLRIAFILN